jgi:hypothetical protein
MRRCFARKFRTVLIKGDEYHGVLHKVRVVQHGVNVMLQSRCGVGNIRVVSIIVQVGRNEHVHRGIRAQSNVVLKVLLGIDNIAAALGVVSDVVKRHEGVVLAVLRISGPFFLLVGNDTHRT